MVIFLATSAYIQVPHPDDSLLIQALAHRGFESQLLTWGTIPAQGVVVIRTTWDYYHQLSNFLTWVSQLEVAGVQLLNPPSTVRWNANKNYLLELQDLGVSMLPTSIVDEISPLPNTRFILKPTISAGAYLTEYFDSHDEARHHIRRIEQIGAQTLLQPFANEIQNGELSLVFFALPHPTFSHAVLKKPKDADFRVQGDFGGLNERVYPAQEVVDQALLILEKVPVPFVYARVDGILRGDTLMLMEIELIEPELFSQYASGSADLFAHAIELAIFSDRIHRA